MAIYRYNIDTSGHDTYRGPHDISRYDPDIGWSLDLADTLILSKIFDLALLLTKTKRPITTEKHKSYVFLQRKRILNYSDQNYFRLKTYFYIV